MNLLIALLPVAIAKKMTHRRYSTLHSATIESTYPILNAATYTIDSLSKLFRRLMPYTDRLFWGRNFGDRNDEGTCIYSLPYVAPSETYRTLWNVGSEEPVND